jgi:hypothetical protein
MMNCKRARLSIALAVGNDLDGAAETQLQQHLAGCTSCRTHRRELESSLGALQAPPDEEVFASHDSVWPALLARLPSMREQRFNGWIPAAALAAAVLMMISIVNEPPQYGSTDGEPYAVRALGVVERSDVPPPLWPGLEQRRNVSAIGPRRAGPGDSRVQWWYNPETGEIFGRIVPSYNR